MRSAPCVLAMISMTFGACIASPLAGSAPSPGAPPLAAGITEISLGQIDSAAAPGSRLEVVEQRWAPAAFATRHVHPAALVMCVQEGALGFTLQHGAATLTRDGARTEPGLSASLPLQTTVMLRPRDCIAFDEFSVHTEHTAWNASAGPTLLWEARLRDPRMPFTTYVEAARLLEPRRPFAGSGPHASDPAR